MRPGSDWSRLSTAVTLPRNTNEPWAKLRVIFLREFGGEAGGPFDLALAVFLDLLVGVIAMQFDDALAAANFRHQIVGFGGPPGEQVDRCFRTNCARDSSVRRDSLGLVIGRIGKGHHGLDGLALARERHLLAGRRGASGRRSPTEIHAGEHWEADRNLLERLIEDAAHVGRARSKLRPLLLDIVQLFAEEPQPAVLLAKRNDRVLQQRVDGLLDLVGQEAAAIAGCIRPRHCATRHGQVAEDLEDRNGLADALAQLVVREADETFSTA